MVQTAIKRKSHGPSEIDPELELVMDFVMDFVMERGTTHLLRGFCARAI
jgi:hypothetical protein